MEFQRLRKKQGWKRGDEAGDVAWQNFRSALVLEFNARFGTQASDLLAWQTLCAIVGIKEASKMSRWEACEKLLKSRHFNLIDVIDAHRRGKNETVQTFATAEELYQHTKNTAAYFPKYHEASGSLLKCVLRRLPITGGTDTKDQPIKHNFQPSKVTKHEGSKERRSTHIGYMGEVGRASGVLGSNLLLPRKQEKQIWRSELEWKHSLPHQPREVEEIEAALAHPDSRI